jgi:hypothetical protein
MGDEAALYVSQLKCLTSLDLRKHMPNSESNRIDDLACRYLSNLTRLNTLNVGNT